MYFKKTANIWIPIIVIIVMVGLTMLNLELDKQVVLEDQFAIRWNAARSWMKEGWSPYSEETRQAALDLLEVNKDLPNEREQGYFLDPAWFVYLFIPISFVPYSIAKAIWMMLTQLSIAVSFLLGVRLSGLKLKGIEVFLICFLGALFYPAVRASLGASMQPIFVMLTLLAIQLALKGQGNQAGLLLLFAIWINPVAIFVVVFLLIYLGSRRDNSLARILLIGFAFLLVTTLILFPNWIQQWFASLIRLDPGLDWLDTPLMGLARAFPGAYLQVAIALHLLSFIVLLVEWYGLGGRGERGMQWKLMLTLIVSYFFNLYSDGAIILFILPAFFSIFKYLGEKWPVSGKILLWISFIAIGILSWQTVPDPFNGFPKEHAAIFLLVPITVFLGLQYFRWWAIASPKALVESKNNNY
ncbi:MAG TPA: hypothetical protein DD636_05350 [Anaerolineaceae bacterium]|nr:hypothetical protein [Anaerolineaceae bacterium]